MDFNDLTRKMNEGRRQERWYTLEQVKEMYENMPSQRVGVLFDLARIVKSDPAVKKAFLASKICSRI